MSNNKKNSRKNIAGQYLSQWQRSFVGMILALVVVCGTAFADTAQSGANFVVNNAADSDDGVCGTSHCTLREAINAANSNANVSIITFAITGTIGINSDLPSIAATTTITGPGARLLNVDVNGFRKEETIFTVNAGKTVTISGLSFQDGWTLFSTLAR